MAEREPDSLGAIFKKLRTETGPLFAAGPEAAPPAPEPQEPENVAKLRLQIEELRAALAEAQGKALETLARVQAREEVERQAQAMFEAARVQARLEEAKRLERDLTERLLERVRELEARILTDRRADELADRIARLEARAPSTTEGFEQRLSRLEEALRLGSRAFADLSGRFEDEFLSLRRSLSRLAEALRLRSELGR